MGRKRDSSNAELNGAPPSDELTPLPGKQAPVATEEASEETIETGSINDFFRPLVLPPSPHRARVRHLDIRLSREQIDAVAGLTLFLDRRGAMLANRIRVVKPVDAIRWMIERMAGLDDPSEGVAETEPHVSAGESARTE